MGRIRGEYEKMEKEQENERKELKTEMKAWREKKRR